MQNDDNKREATSERSGDAHTHASLAFSADKNVLVYSTGDTAKKIPGGLGLPLLLYFTLTLINKDILSYTDEVIADPIVEKENAHEHSLGIARGEERVTLFTLFSALTATNAPDAAIALSKHIARLRNGKSTVTKLKEIAESWGVEGESVKNLTGRYYATILNIFPSNLS